MSKPRANMTFEQSRKELLKQMISKSKGKVQEKVIHFRNDDVPKFLQNLDKFEKQPRKSRIVIK
ncbi:MAG: hypothetical protein MAG551_01186 [Candidatus Scalindua arabica]|uniref:Uncharacterized protein n=1 Tax=Candidatus Scalindua arabica TaxID=1127984 RepID=A0A941ZZX2_9BACT|nr:hypothetical protein [Candidatus Scalindua arabica]